MIGCIVEKIHLFFKLLGVFVCIYFLKKCIKSFHLLYLYSFYFIPLTFYYYNFLDLFFYYKLLFQCCTYTMEKETAIPI